MLCCYPLVFGATLRNGNDDGSPCIGAINAWPLCSVLQPEITDQEEQVDRDVTVKDSA